MKVKELTINCAPEFQAKFMTMFIKKASGFKSKIWIVKNERKANAKSLLGILSLGMLKGAKVSLIADGEDEEQAARELEAYLCPKAAEQ